MGGGEGTGSIGGFGGGRGESVFLREPTGSGALVFDFVDLIKNRGNLGLGF